MIIVSQRGSFSCFEVPFCLDHNENGWGVFAYAREKFPSRGPSEINYPKEVECIIIEINLHKTRWASLGIYWPPSQTEIYFFEEIGRAIGYHSPNHENFVVISDLIMKKAIVNLAIFLEIKA